MIKKDNKLWDKPQDYSYMWELEKEPPEDWKFDMRELTPKQTNLPTTIWIDDTMQFRKEKFSPPIVIILCDCSEFWVDDIIRLIPVTISETPKILIPDELFKAKNELSTEQWDNIFKFISRNHNILLAHWNGTLEKDILELMS